MGQVLSLVHLKSEVRADAAKLLQYQFFFSVRRTVFRPAGSDNLRNQKSPPVPAIFFKRFSCYSIKRCSVFQIFPDGKWLVQHTVLKYHAKHCSNFPSDLIQICALDLNRSAVFAKLPADDRNRCALSPAPFTPRNAKSSPFSPENSDH